MSLLFKIEYNYNDIRSFTYSKGKLYLSLIFDNITNFKFDNSSVRELLFLTKTSDTHLRLTGFRFKLIADVLCQLGMTNMDAGYSIEKTNNWFFKPIYNIVWRRKGTPFLIETGLPSYLIAQQMAEYIVNTNQSQRGNFINYLQTGKSSKSQPSSTKETKITPIIESVKNSITVIPSSDPVKTIPVETKPKKFHKSAYCLSYFSDKCVSIYKIEDLNESSYDDYRQVKREHISTIHTSIDAAIGMLMSQNVMAYDFVTYKIIKYTASYQIDYWAIFWYDEKGLPFLVIDRLYSENDAIRWARKISEDRDLFRPIANSNSPEGFFKFQSNYIKKYQEYKTNQGTTYNAYNRNPAVPHTRTVYPLPPKKTWEEAWQEGAKKFLGENVSD